MKQRLLDLIRRTGGLRLAFRGVELLKTASPGTLVSNLRYRTAGAPDGLPIPGAKLLVLVAGNADVRAFLDGGAKAVESIETILSRNDIDIDEMGAILDFGCGCGRVIRHWRGRSGLELYGTDYNPELIAWCRRQLPFATFGVNQLKPPTSFAEGQFDLIYAFSVFTHLPEDVQHAWMKEYYRLLKPGGYLILSLHGDHYYALLSEQEQRHYSAGNLVVKFAEVAGTNMCSAFHPEQYVRQELAGPFEILDFSPEGARGNPTQDLYLFQRPLESPSRS